MKPLCRYFGDERIVRAKVALIQVSWNQCEQRARSLSSPLWGGSARSAGVGVVRSSTDGSPPPTPPHKGRGIAFEKKPLCHRLSGCRCFESSTNPFAVRFCSVPNPTPWFDAESRKSYPPKSRPAGPSLGRDSRISNCDTPAHKGEGSTPRLLRVRGHLLRERCKPVGIGA